MDDIDEIVQEFLVESYENLDQLDQDLVALEDDPGSRELLSRIFRTIHTIKGTSGFLAFGNLERLTHTGEGLLVDLREGRRLLDGPTTDVLLALVDTVRAILAAIESDGGDAAVDVEPVVATLEAHRDGSGAGQPSAAGTTAERPSAGSATRSPAASTTAERPSAERADRPHAPAPEPRGTVSDDADDDDAPDDDLDDDLDDDPDDDPDDDVDTEPVPGAPTQGSATAADSASAQPGPGPAPARPADSTIRVRVDLLDHLMQEVGELVVLRNTIGRIADAGDDSVLTRAAQRLSLLTGELQGGVLRARMQPVDQIFSSMPRLVRTLAEECKRQVHLSMVGGSTEADRTLLEAVKDPLTHLVRNAVDHGIEPAVERMAAGKAPFGTVALQALHAGGHVVIEVRDDGRGIDPAKVAARAIERGLRTAEQLQTMTRAEILQLLFLPGFTTAESVSRVSGRGVGMDVVRTKVEAVGGTVDFDSTVGEGTTWHLRIPLTLAILPVLTVETADQTFALPQAALRELIALDDGEEIEHVGPAPVYRLRGELLPLVALDRFLGLGGGAGARTIVVLKAHGRRFGLLVDRVLDTVEIVVTPLPERLRQVGAYNGATVLGDGRVALLLDPRAVARRSHAVLGVAPPVAVPEPAAPEARRVLVLAVGDGRRVAVPISSVSRIERIAATRVERVGRHEVVQLRGVIVPLVRLDRVLGVADAPDPAELLVVVYHHDDRSVAMVVNEILDIVADDEGRHSAIEDTGLIGSTVLDEHVTGLLDGDALVRSVTPGFYGEDGDPLVDAVRELVGS
ncbi:chemotaxis protein CheW [Georgenia sp. SYP-B2076]|uniref:chemotaxis protein CheW n=1 Tax=Georgenia sp. SYP-B2076 TaxID=2495881 RepID=UPI000F8EDBBF|nr:chemotaxis protein CheW [Georgenia sp. SYP-B2076]